jgi:hypothetical protein
MAACAGSAGRAAITAAESAGGRFSRLGHLSWRRRVTGLSNFSWGNLSWGNFLWRGGSFHGRSRFGSNFGRALNIRRGGGARPLHVALNIGAVFVRIKSVCGRRAKFISKRGRAARPI